MAHNQTRTSRMIRKADKDVLALYMAKTLSSAAAAYELRRRNLPLPVRPPTLPR